MTNLADFASFYAKRDLNTLYTVVHCVKFIINYWDEFKSEVFINALQHLVQIIMQARNVGKHQTQGLI